MAVTETKITLDTPITVAEKETTELTFRKLTIGDMLDATVQATMDYGIEPNNGILTPYAYAIACDVPVEELLKLGAEETKKFDEALAFLAGGGQEETVEQTEEDKTDDPDAPKVEAKDDPDSPEKTD